MILFRLICFAFVFTGVIIAFLNAFISRKNHNYPKKRKDGHDFCVLVPARYESLVIEDLLVSLKKQTIKINMKDVYVIVESKDDESVKICEKYGATVFIRKRLELQRKGYALDEAVKYILRGKKRYDAYFIFDADNVLDKNFIKNMIPVFDKGYDFASGYRNCKNGNESVVAACSALTFSLVNTVFNDSKNKETRNITFSGTGFYIRGYLIEKWGGYPFHSLTEDYELSSYATLNNLTTYYNVKSVFYDEQPVKYKNTINQRIRWIRGYFDVRRMYTKKMYAALDKNDPNNGSKLDEAVGILPYTLMVIGLVVWFLALIFFTLYNLLLQNDIWKSHALELIFFLGLVYVVLLVMTFVILCLEGKKIALTNKSKLKVLLVNPLYMITYVPCAIKALTSKEVAWTRVIHGETKKD